MQKRSWTDAELHDSISSLSFSEAHDLVVNVKMFFRELRTLQASLKQETGFEVLVMVIVRLILVEILLNGFMVLLNYREM